MEFPPDYNQKTDKYFTDSSSLIGNKYNDFVTFVMSGISGYLNRGLTPLGSNEISP